MLKFDSATTKLLEESYQGADIRRRRRASFDALAPRGGQHLLDLGCGNGLLTEELARAVGETGHVTGLDPSQAMLDAARTRLAIRENVSLIQGVAEDIPLENASLDGALSVQVFEYFSDSRPALHELHRVLKPGARLVISDMHFDTLVWHSDVPDRMEKMLSAYDGHLENRILPEQLPGLLKETGFELDDLTPVVFCNTHLAPDSTARMMIELVSNYGVSTGAVSLETAEDWRAEQFELDQQGRFFFSINHYVCRAVRRS